MMSNCAVIRQRHLGLVRGQGRASCAIRRQVSVIAIYPLGPFLWLTWIRWIWEDNNMVGTRQFEGNAPSAARVADEDAA